jgi:hypothetical protein
MAMTCFNLALNGTLTSSGMSGAIMAMQGANHHDIESMTIEDIRQGLFQGVLSPSSAVILAAALARENRTLFNIDRAYDAIQCQLRADVELEFERVRRDVAPDAVSRLQCIWLAENSDVGRKMIEQMFLSPDLHFLDIEVLTYRKVLKADSTHFDNYCHRPHRGHAVSYWEGAQANDSPQWEYLVDGQVRATVQSQIDSACLAHWDFNRDWWDKNHPTLWFMDAVKRAQNR